MRMLVHGWFAPRPLESWRPLVKSVINELLDEAEQKGRMDVMEDFATPIPLMVIAQMLVLPRQDRAFLRDLAKMILRLNSGDRDRMSALADGMKGLDAYLSPLIDERIKNPKDDLLSVLAQGESKGIATRDESVANATLLLSVGHTTTLNLICNGALALIQHPDQWDLLQEDPSGRMVRATEECLRYDPPVKSIHRIALEDVELSGKVIKKHDRLRWSIAGANRDPKVFSDPDTFDITRHPNPHVAFGSGIHHCLGATLARMEGQEAFKALVERFPRLHLDTEELEYEPVLNFRSLKSLPVTWG